MSERVFLLGGGGTSEARLMSVIGWFCKKILHLLSPKQETVMLASEVSKQLFQMEAPSGHVFLLIIILHLFA